MADVETTSPIVRAPADSGARHADHVTSDVTDVRYVGVVVLSHREKSSTTSTVHNGIDKECLTRLNCTHSLHALTIYTLFTLTTECCRYELNKIRRYKLCIGPTSTTCFQLLISW